MGRNGQTRRDGQRKKTQTTDRQTQIDRTDGQIVTDTVGETPMTDRQTDIDRQQMNRQKQTKINGQKQTSTELYTDRCTKTGTQIDNKDRRRWTDM